MAADAPLAGARDDAIRAFCDAEYARVARYCYRLVGDVHLAHDVAQEAFERLFGRWIDIRDPRSYVYVLATNVARRHWRGQGIEHRAYAKLGDHDRVVDGPDAGIRDVVDRLPRRWRDVVLLHYYADLPVTDVARCLGQPVGTVKRRLAEARELLASALRESR